MAITKEEIIANPDQPVTVVNDEGQQFSGKIFKLTGQQINGYQSSSDQKAYIVLEGDDPARPSLFDLEQITLS